MHAAGLLRKAISLGGIVVLLAALDFALRDGVRRWLILLVAAPFGFLWALGFSYDLRNLALAVPFLGAAAGIGIAELGGLLRWNVGRRASRVAR